MANLYGWVEGDRAKSAASRMSNERITVQAETWDGSVRVDLDKNGNFEVLVGDKDSPQIVIAHGNVNENTRSAFGVEDGANVPLMGLAK